jgi:tRNA (guanine-N7-)-methyltransferase
LPELEKSSMVFTRPSELKGNWKSEFNNNGEIHLELGSGMGGFISTISKENQNVNYVGVDLKNEVLVYALRKVQEAEVSNVRLIPMNITLISEVFDTNEINRIYINFCNPWPKERQNKRRLTHTRFLTEYKKFLSPGSEVWFKTDDTGLFEASQDYFKDCGFNIEYLTYDLHKSDFKENIVTEYEAKFTSLGMKTMFLLAKLK